MVNREYPSQPIVGVGVVIIREGCILIVKRGNEPGKGKWAIPGGLVGLGESLTSAAVREVMEETNLKITIGDVAAVFDYIEQDSKGKIRFHYVIIDFFANNVEGAAKPSSDVEAIAWVDFNDVYKYELTSSTRKLMQKILSTKLKIN
ncbi:MAG: NUDIX hydrolase [Candidatus Odinarchaeota archaeon]